MKSESELRAEIVAVGRLLWERGLVGATEGNISCRVGNLGLLCTPSGVSKGHLHPDELVLIDLHGHPLRRGLPSSEIRLHLRFFQDRPDVQAVVHAHPPVATAFALAHRAIPSGLLPEAVVILGDIALCEFGMPGTDELPNSLTGNIATHDTFLLSNHGAVTTGHSVMDAFWRMETLERVAVVYAHAEQLGGAKPLPDDAVARLNQLRVTMKSSVAPIGG